jgi:hypothetical protein
MSSNQITEILPANQTAEIVNQKLSNRTQEVFFNVIGCKQAIVLG